MSTMNPEELGEMLKDRLLIHVKTTTQYEYGDGDTRYLRTVVTLMFDGEEISSAEDYADVGKRR